jgi:hypothetical protein
MDKREALAAALHLELERLTSELLITTDEAQRHRVHRRISFCIRERIMLIHQLQHTSWAAQTLFLKPLCEHHASKS